jgi:hypothetical protein
MVGGPSMYLVLESLGEELQGLLAEALLAVPGGGVCVCVFPMYKALWTVLI